MIVPLQAFYAILKSKYQNPARAYKQYYTWFWNYFWNHKYFCAHLICYK